MRRGLSLLLAAGCVGGLACPKEQPLDPTSDRTLQKLQAEQQRLAQGGAPHGPPPAAQPIDPLAEAAAAQEPPHSLTLPAASKVVEGALTLELKKVEVSQTVKGPKVALTTPARFVRVVVAATTTSPIRVSLGGAELVQGAARAGVAGDVQRIVQGSPLEADLEPGVTQALVLYFEAPPEMMGPGLKILLPVGKKALELPLQ